MASVSRDYSWQPSQGIRFVPSSRGKVWQPSQDIIFSSSLATTVASHTIQSPRSRSPPLSSSSNPRPSIQSRTLDPNALRKKRLPPPANRPLGSYRESGVDYDLTSNIPEKLSTSRRKPYSVINPEGKGSRLSATRQKRVEEQRMRFQRLPEQSAANEWAAQGEAARQEAKQKEANQRELQKQEAAKQKKAEQLALMAAQGLGATERRLTEECQKLSFGDVNEGKSKRLLLKPNRRDLDSRHQSRLIRSQWNTLATEFKLSDIADDIVRSFRGGLLPLINRFCYNTAASISALNQTEKATTAGLPRSAQSQIPPDYFPVTKLNTMPDAPSASWNYPISANNPSSRLVSQICSLGAKNNLVLESSRLEPPRLEHQFLRKCESTPLGKSFTKPQSKRSTTTSQHTKELQRLSRAESLDSSSVAAEMCCSPMEIPTLLIPGAESLEESSPLARGPPGNIATSMPTSGPPEFLSLSPTRSLKGSVMASSVPLEDDVNAGESEKSLSKHDEDLRTSQRDQGDQRTHHTPLQFKIPKDILREKMLASKSTTAAHWQHTLYRDPSGEKVRVHFCVSYESTERIAQLFLDKDVIGFDIEWRPQATAADGIKKNVSLIQLASEERIALFHIARYATGDTADELVTPSLRKILASPKITKVGVSIKSDCTRLRKFLAIEARGLFELSHLYKLIKYSNHNVKKVNKKLVSLAQQVEEHLQLPLGKGPVRLSPWDEPLSYEQISYAASDSYAGLQLYDVMESKRVALVPTPPRPAHAELNLPIRLADGVTVVDSEEPEEVVAENTSEGRRSQSTGVEDMVKDLKITMEDSEQGSSAAKTVKTTSISTCSNSLEVIAAEDWIAQWQASLPSTYRCKASVSLLTAYALWHAQARDVPEIALLLRNPPLHDTTVSMYILEAIRIEKLTFDVERLQKVLSYFAKSALRGRYQWLQSQIAGR